MDTSNILKLFLVFLIAMIQLELASSLAPPGRKPPAGRTTNPRKPPGRNFRRNPCRGINETEFETFIFDAPKLRDRACYYILNPNLKDFDHQNKFQLDQARNACLENFATFPNLATKENAMFVEKNISMGRPFVLGLINGGFADGLVWTKEWINGHKVDYEPEYWTQTYARDIDYLQHFTYAQMVKENGTDVWEWMDAIADDPVPQLLVICERRVGYEAALRGPPTEGGNGAVGKDMWKMEKAFGMMILIISIMNMICG